MSVRLTLVHGREGEAYNGKITMEYEDGGVGVSKELDTFTSFRFPRMMSRFAKHAIDHPDAVLHMERSERPDLKSFILDERTSELLRTDPATAIQSMMPAPRKVLKVNTDVRTQDSVKSQIRAGHDTLADSFGDDIYLKLRFQGDGVFEAECPWSGKWVGLGAKAEDTSQILLKTGRQNAHRDWLPVELVPMSKTENPRWAKVKTKVLLDLASTPVSLRGSNRFFIPRRWNETSPWIFREALQQRYDAYLKEKGEANV